MRLIVFILATILCDFSLSAELTKITSVARVAGKSISSRGVLIDHFLEYPKKWPGSQKFSETGSSGEDRSRALDRIIIQEMLKEENRIFRSVRIEDSELQLRFVQLEKSFGDQFLDFQKYFDLDRQEIREHLRSRLIYEKSLEDKLESLTGAEAAKPNPEEFIRSWILELKNRYRVQILGSP